MADPPNAAILIVDDEEDLREALAFDFKRKGYQVLTASGGIEAFRLITDRQVDLVITDLNMPEGSGAELLARIRETLVALPVIMFISDSSPTGNSLVPKADVIMSKPFNMKELHRAVVTLLACAATKKVR